MRSQRLHSFDDNVLRRLSLYLVELLVVVHGGLMLRLCHCGRPRRPESLMLWVYIRPTATDRLRIWRVGEPREPSPR
jgi:hypothetical protein